jgi:hypothetical protein
MRTVRKAWMSNRKDHEKKTKSSNVMADVSKASRMKNMMRKHRFRSCRCSVWVTIEKAMVASIFDINVSIIHWMNEQAKRERETDGRTDGHVRQNEQFDDRLCVDSRAESTWWSMTDRLAASDDWPHWMPEYIRNGSMLPVNTTMNMFDFDSCRFIFTSDSRVRPTWFDLAQNLMSTFEKAFGHILAGHCRRFKEHEI